MAVVISNDTQFPEFQSTNNCDNQTLLNLQRRGFNIKITNSNSDEIKKPKKERTYDDIFDENGELREDMWLDLVEECSINDSDEDSIEISSEIKSVHPFNDKDSKSSSLENLQNVEICQNTSENQYSCEICGKVFNQRVFLQQHLRVHTNYRPYECSMCMKRFSQRSILTRHEKSHLGIKLFNCEICGQSFTRNTTLRAHLLIHTGERPHQCEVCHRSFRLKAQLQQHKLTHDKSQCFKCEICGRTYSKQVNFVQHRCSTQIPPQSFITIRNEPV